ncbi:MAG: helix-turn-helix transcriptional regulator [Oscillospiraceae bacterium]|nr:helix-turn-helix transcriptional regulator [Oscillospiraceae bacterium]
MQLEELKLVAAGNLINLRTAAGLTQAELGAKLNYSDKSISKWERGEAIPDAYVLTQMAELFGVTVDYILSSHTSWEPTRTAEDPKQDVVYSTSVIIAIAVLGVWTLALTAFVALWLADMVRWKIFVAAFPVSVLTWMVLLCIFKRTHYLKYVVALFVLSLFGAFYLLFLNHNPWQIFLIAVLAEALVFLSFHVQKRPKKGTAAKMEKAGNEAESP